MEIRGAVVFLLCVTFAQLSFQTQQQCLNIMMKNSVDTVTEVSFFTHLDKFVIKNKIVELISAYWTWRLDVTTSFWIAYTDTKVNVKLENIILKTKSDDKQNPDFYIDKYHNFGKNESLAELQELLKQNISNSINNARLPDTVITHLKNIIITNSLVTVYMTVMANKFYINFTGVARNDCFVSSNYNHNQRQKRSAKQNTESFYKWSGAPPTDVDDDTYGHIVCGKFPVDNKLPFWINAEDPWKCLDWVIWKIRYDPHVGQVQEEADYDSTHKRALAPAEDNCVKKRYTEVDICSDSHELCSDCLLYTSRCV